jgi:hypothetical protein
MTAPSCARNTITVSARIGSAKPMPKSARLPSTTPTRISPSTTGCPARPTSEPNFAATRMTATQEALGHAVRCRARERASAPRRRSRAEREAVVTPWRAPLCTCAGRQANGEDAAARRGGCRSSAPASAPTERQRDGTRTRVQAVNQPNS